MLGIGSGFDPETLVILETAFDEAWIADPPTFRV
jgi:hypothetical protein